MPASTQRSRKEEAHLSSFGSSLKNHHLCRSFHCFISIYNIFRIPPLSNYIMSLRSLLLLVSLWITCSTTNAFVVIPSCPAHVATTALGSTLHHDTPPPTVENNNDGMDVSSMVALSAKFMAVLTIKTAKDMVQYPPQFLDAIVREVSGKDQMNPAVLVIKFLGVLVFKGVHDVLYFPLIWSERLAECQSLDECPVE